MQKSLSPRKRRDGDVRWLLVFYEGVYSEKGQFHDARAVNHEGSISALIFATVVVQEAKV